MSAIDDDATLVCSVCEKVLESEEEQHRGRCAGCTPACSVCGCELRWRWEVEHTMCVACGESTGLTAIVDPRPRIPCRGCGHHELVRAILRERTDRPSSTGALAPFAITFATISGATPDTERPAGIVVAYVCRKCALTELYTSGHTEIPIGAEYGTSLIDVRGPVPYR